MFHIEITSELDHDRLMQTPGIADISRGMAEIFEDKPIGVSLGFFTLVFAERFCSETPGYVWRKI